MKIVKILLSHSKNMDEASIKAFLYRNMTADIISGLEYDDPKTILRALKLLGVNPEVAKNVDDEFYHDADPTPVPAPHAKHREKQAEGHKS